MYIYYFIFLLAFLLCFIEVYAIKTHKKSIYIVFCVFIMIVVGIREIGIDNDSMMYVEEFNRIVNNSRSSEKFFEYGYIYVVKCLGGLGFNASSQFLVFAIMTGVLNYTFFYKNSPYPLITLYLYICFFLIHRDFNQIRFSLSCSLIFWSVYCYTCNRKLEMMVLIIISGLFHNTAWFLIPIFFLIHYFHRRWVYFVIIMASMIIGYSVDIFNFILKIFIEEIGILHNYKYYLYHYSGRGSYSIILYALITLILFCTYFRKKEEKLEIYFKILSMCVVCGFLFIQSLISQRIILLLFQFSVLILPYIFEKMVHFHRRVITISSILLITLLYGLNTIDRKIIRPYRINSDFLLKKNIKNE